MSGPEWTPEHSDAPVERRPLSAPLGAGGSIESPQASQFGPNLFGADRAKGFDPKRVEQDDAEAESNRLDDEEATARPGKLAGLVGAIRSAIVGLWNRRRKPARPVVDYDQTADPAPDQTPGDSHPDHDGDSDSDEDSSAKPSRRWAPSAWTWETRVGVAAVLSFLILVGVFVVKKDRDGGGKALALELPKPGDETKSKNPDKSKSNDPTKLAITSTKPRVGKTADPSNISPPAPDLLPGSADRGVDAATAVESPRAPNSPPSTSVASNSLDLPSTVDPTILPDPAGVPVVSSNGADLTLPSAGDASKPPELPGPTGDAVPLSNDPPGGRLPTPTASNEVKPDPDPKSKLPEVEPAPPTNVVGSTPQPEPPPTTESAPEPPSAQPAIVAAAAPPQPTTPPPPEPKVVVEAAPPRPAKPPSSLETVPASATVGSAAALGPGWVMIPSGGKRPGGSSSGDSGTTDNPSGIDSPTTARVADGPPIRDDPAPSETGGGPVLHTVGPDENFWTISKDYYNSHRYYKALHKANAAQVPDIAKLYVGTVIRIPPPEALDRSLVEPPTIGAANDGAVVNRVSSPKTSDPGAELAPTRTTRPGLRRARSEPTEEPRRPSYKVKSNDTLRSIARDTLSDSKRAGEIFNLNRDLLVDPKAPLAVGTSLTLPEDAVIGRRSR